MSVTITVSATDAVGATASTTVTAETTGAVPVSVLTTQAPAQPNFTDGPAYDYELGMKFSSSVPGQITAIRYWRAAGETGAHTGRIWSASGTLLASVAFSNDTGSGWKQQALASPLPISAGATYVVSVNAHHHYTYTDGGFDSGITNGVLTAPASAGVFNDDQAVFPNSVFHNENYFRDVVFIAGEAPTLQPPVVSNGSFNVVASGVTVGTMSASNSPTSWAITGGNAAGYFSISNAGVISASAAVVAGSYSLTCQATNSAGSGTGSASVVVTEAGSFVWPNASNTGVPAGTNLTPYTGPTTITQNGTVISEKRITRMLAIDASDVRFERCWIEHAESWGINSDAGDRLVVIDCTFKGPGTAGQMAAAVLGDGTFLRNNISGSSFGLNLQGKATVQRNFIHDLGFAGSPHYDGLMCQGSNVDTLIEDNWIAMPNTSGTAGVTITPHFGNVANVTVNHNRILGKPGYTCQATSNPNGTMSGITFTNNEMERGEYGYWYIDNTPTPVRSGNKDAFTGANIDNQQ